jgi:type II secretory pathway component GspD/PulD (secretin)
MNTLKLIVLACVAVFGAAVTAAQTPAASSDLSKLTPKSAQVSVTFENAQIGDALTKLGEAAGVTIKAAPGVTLPPTQLTLSYTNAKLVDVLRQLATINGLSYTVADPKTLLVSLK